MAKLVVRLSALYASACLLGFGLLVGAFQVGVLSGIDILFYRGLVLIAVATILTFVLLGIALRRLSLPELGLRDAFAASILSLSLNTCFLVVVPVTVDRSISIFLLGAMAARGDAPLTPDAASAMFKTVYVDDYRQIERRLHEQTVSGNVEKVGDGYRISGRGRFVVEVGSGDRLAVRQPCRPRRAIRRRAAGHAGSVRRKERSALIYEALDGRLRPGRGPKMSSEGLNMGHH